MSFLGLLLLPAIAAILIFQGTWLGNGFASRGRPEKYQRQFRARVLIHRSLIISLLLATFIVFTSSLNVLPHWVQGLLLTVIMMLPVLVYLLLAHLFTVVRGWPVKKTPPTGYTFKQKIPERYTRLATDTAQFPRTDEDSFTLEQGEPEPSVLTRSDNSLRIKLLNACDENSDWLHNYKLNLEEQMDNIDRSVNHADIGAEAVPGNNEFSLPPRTQLAPVAQQNTLAAAQDSFESDLALCTADQETIPATDYNELTEMVVRLQKEKIKLQKLTIAQKAVIETERQRNQKAKVMTQDAMTVMRSAREKASDAIKIARHERRERLRLEADYAKARVQMENAMSAKRIMKSVNG